MTRNLILILFVFYSISGRTSSMFSIQNTSCSKYIHDKFGMISRNICIYGDDVYVCTNSSPPFGAKLPESFFQDFDLQKSNLPESLRANCRALESNIPIKSANNCSQSDHPLFQPFINRLGLPLHSCFCSVDEMPVLSVCILSNGVWQSTSEFDSRRVQEDLNEICAGKTDENYNIACFCNKYYGSNLSDYVGCLKTQTTKKNQEDQNLKKISPSRGIQ